MPRAISRLRPQRVLGSAAFSRNSSRAAVPAVRLPAAACFQPLRRSLHSDQRPLFQSGVSRPQQSESLPGASHSPAALVSSGWLYGAVAAALAGSALLWSQSQAAAKEKESQKGQDSQQEEEDNESLQARHKKTFDALQALLGDRISVDLEDRSGHGKDAYSYHSDKPPWAVVYPLSTEEVSAIARICYESRVVMIPYGSGTSLEGHTTAPSGGVVLDMSRMRALKAVHEQDMDAVVEPGISWGELNEQLKQYGLFYPVDPGPGASIGGMCGTSCSGTNAVRYGTMRYNVLNLTVVLADGTILKTAQRARKSSAGYSLTHLFIGSEGTLGVITEATLRLQNIPEQTAVAVCAFPSVHHAAGAAIAVMRKGVQVGCVELLDEVCVKIVNGYVGLSLPEKPTIFFKFHGSAAGVKDEVERVQQAIKPFQPGAFDWATEAEKRDRIWEGRKGALWATMAYRPEAQVWTTDVCLPISRLADCIEATKKDIEQSGLLAPIVGHVGDGNFHVMLSVDPGNEEEMRVAQGINQRMVQRAIQMEGTCTGEHGVGVGKRDYLDHELGVTTVETMRRVKAALDPFGLMNPGKVFRLKEQTEPAKDKTHWYDRLVRQLQGGKQDRHDQRPDFAAAPAQTAYVGAPVGKPDASMGDPPITKHDPTPSDQQQQQQQQPAKKR